MAKHISVTLNTTETPPFLQVDISKLKIGKKSKHEIVWEIDRNVHLTFVSLAASEPGFSWLDPAPPEGVFGPPIISINDPKILSIEDNNTKENSPGSWSYCLRAEDKKGHVYTTCGTVRISVPPNPIIINE